jgi:hypothetical protein
VQQAVHREHGVERAGREVQVQEVHDVSLDALRPAALDHRGRQIGGDDGEALLLEVRTVLPGARADLKQPRSRCQPLRERPPLGQLPWLFGQPVAVGRAPVVGLPERAEHLVIADGHIGHYRLTGAAGARRRR